MSPVSNEQSEITRTERGLTISGTRITIYDVIDHLVAGRPPQLILNWLPLTEEQLEVALSYIEANRAEVEAEYQEVLKTAAVAQQYWEARNRERFAQIDRMPPKFGQEALWEKLQAQKAKHTVE
ncbi:DUF433 domain-containing protein [Phormidesmis priestleyi ULC007]|uniref:DUF433 domain-containing protein n=1 Tax=Phormidesmis priestleyi ULC007 TaxID=1920490 RepID=A0A2T1DK71_9CYAN|nr:DUF433 domain-containing protein [Phormidesmis priestleyi]PSB20851.1 DUF433 domain-containing protein [Phormidesmis priestleyi ULC007]PZO51806.1 MAG: DUF433 domain-containing protein [Phormidesmis priestleyi]